METSTLVSTFSDWQEYWNCSHTDTAIRWRTRRNGVGCWAVQCIVCGRELRQVSKTSPEVRQLVDRIPFDEGLLERIQSQMRFDLEQRRERQQAEWEAQQQAVERERNDQNAEWWKWYDQYLKTPEWKRKRALVMERANGICEGCRQRKAAQVHHLTYDHAGDEFLFELVAICGACHQRIHPHME